MRRQVFGFNPATGRVEHHYVECGPARALPGHGGPIQMGVVMGTRVDRDNVKQNGGGKTPRRQQAA